ncbi:MAG TPA: alpha-2-macroglobulin family protein, partial [Candidatus Acidoferrales bacterium]|nr:alpha-2-macroglobulin family protein [Candidatus Acidoferrales bacterium]
GVDFDSLRDPWGRPYRLDFPIYGPDFEITITSAGPDGRFDSPTAHSTDDIVSAAASINYFLEPRNRIARIVTGLAISGGRAPETQEELAAILRAANFDWEALRDPWGHAPYTTFNREARYNDRVIVASKSSYEEAQKQHTALQPVTAHYQAIHIRSAGPDGVRGTDDDFDLAEIAVYIAEQSAQDSSTRPVSHPSAFAGRTGSLAGLVMDRSGAAIPKAKITATPEPPDPSLPSKEYVATASDEGSFLLENLPAGTYTVRVFAEGFALVTIVAVPVPAGMVTEVNVTLEVAGQMVTVEVQGSAPPLNTTTAMITASAVPGPPPSLPRVSTPRLREYFPETLLWQPELITTPGGRAQVRFPLADSITTWNFSITASTVDGQTGAARREIRAFQPFFIEHDPPRFLTAGDRIDLPIVLRNYLDREQTVNWKVKPEAWFNLDGPGAGSLRVPPSDSARAVFSFTATSPVRDGKQRVTAANAGVSDAVEKSVVVRPDGREITRTTAQMFHGSASLDIPVPADAIPGALRAELKFYPDLLAHVVESMEAILQRPYGCAEQVISSAYPNLLFLRYAKAVGAPPSPQAARAQRNLALGVQRLLAYNAPGGGFRYWTYGDPDVALSAYAIRFLRDAAEFVAVDDSIVLETTKWLLGQMQSDGSWPQKYVPDSPRTAILTAYVARVLSAAPAAAEGAPPDPQGVAARAARELPRALSFLATAADQVDEPYLLAAYALAAQNAGDAAATGRALAKLRGLAHEEGDGAYWVLETNSPFYGWGLAGRVETTALVVQALSRAAGTPSAGTQDAQFISRGVLFLLKNQDHFGVWYSGQATVNVLEALLAVLAAPRPAGQAARNAVVRVNGSVAFEVALPTLNELAAPITRDFSPLLHPGENRVEISATGGGELSAQAVTSYYVSWARSAAATESDLRSGDSDALRFAVHYARTSAHVGDVVECTVEAERIGFRGYGMMLAEIGVPPGADVDRTSLDRAVTESGWAVNHYDVLPDRVILYLWPRAGGTKFAFAFRPRYAEQAQAPASTLYDYYNPQAQALVAPVPFLVQ